VTERLFEWNDSSGERVVERVARRHEVYKGEFVSRASDLFVYWNPRARLGSPPGEVQERGFWWSGDHRPEGILICKGPGIRSGLSTVIPSVQDLVPTILYLAGCSVPDNLDGRVIQEACDESLLLKSPVQMTSSKNATGGEKDRLSQEEERLVKEKLRSLGYI
jgi:predicted AlkP superfamily phosphohydrolase/phosphomutase